MGFYGGDLMRFHWDFMGSKNWGFIDGNYPLDPSGDVLLLKTWPIEIIDLPRVNMVIFQSKLLVY